MTISDKLKKAGNAVIKTAKRTAADAIANEKTRKEAQKTAWKDMGDGKRARNIESYGGFAPAIIWAIGDKVYVSDAHKANVAEITGDEAVFFRASSEGGAAIEETHRSGFGSVSPMDVEMPDYLTSASPADQKTETRKKAQTYEEWMGVMTDSITLFLDFPLPTLNEMIRTARGNKYAAAAQKKKYTDLVAAEIMVQTYPTHYQFDAISLDITWIETKKKRDPDNVFAAVKFILDGIVAADLIKDDDRDHVASITNRLAVSDFRGVAVMVSSVPKPLYTINYT